MTGKEFDGFSIFDAKEIIAEKSFDAGIIEGKRQNQDKIDKILGALKHEHMSMQEEICLGGWRKHLEPMSGNCEYCALIADIEGGK